MPITPHTEEGLLSGEGCCVKAPGLLSGSSPLLTLEAGNHRTGASKLGSDEGPPGLVDSQLLNKPLCVRRKALENLWRLSLEGYY